MDEKTFIHPEKKDDEVFITNASDEGFRTIGWKSKRNGGKAYSPNGEPVCETEKFFPVFIKKSEVLEEKVRFETSGKDIPDWLKDLLAQ